MTYFVYIVESIDSNDNVTYYTGYTNNPERRLREHQSGRGAKHVKNKKVNGMAIIFRIAEKGKAMKLEAFLKKRHQNVKKAFYFLNEKVELIEK